MFQLKDTMRIDLSSLGILVFAEVQTLRMAAAFSLSRALGPTCVSYFQKRVKRILPRKPKVLMGDR